MQMHSALRILVLLASITFTTTPTFAAEEPYYRHQPQTSSEDDNRYCTGSVCIKANNREQQYQQPGNFKFEVNKDQRSIKDPYSMNDYDNSPDGGVTITFGDDD